MQVVKLASEPPQLSVYHNGTELSDNYGNSSYNLIDQRVSIECVSGYSYPSSNLSLFIGTHKLSPHMSLCYKEESMFGTGTLLTCIYNFLVHSTLFRWLQTESSC